MMSMHVEHGVPLVPLPVYVHRISPACFTPAAAQFPPVLEVTSPPLPFSAETLLRIVVPASLVPTKTTSLVFTPQIDSDLTACSQTFTPPCNLPVPGFGGKNGLCHTGGPPLLVSIAYTVPSWDVT